MSLREITRGSRSMSGRKNIANWTGRSKFNRRWFNLSDSVSRSPSTFAARRAGRATPSVRHGSMYQVAVRIITVERFAIGNDSGNLRAHNARSAAVVRFCAGPCLGLTRVARNTQACTCAGPAGAKTMREVAERYSDGPNASKVIWTSIAPFPCGLRTRIAVN
jgi:hypothetical protein